MRFRKIFISVMLTFILATGCGAANAAPKVEQAEAAEAAEPAETAEAAEPAETAEAAEPAETAELAETAETAEQAEVTEYISKVTFKDGTVIEVHFTPGEKIILITPGGEEIECEPETMPKEPLAEEVDESQLDDNWLSILTGVKSMIDNGMID